MAVSTLLLDKCDLSVEDVISVSNQKKNIQIAESRLRQMEDMRTVVEKAARSDRPYYGINTGFGALAEKRIPTKQIKKLQKNLIDSHAVGIGPPLSVQQSRAMLLLRLKTLVQGHSGCRPRVALYLKELLNSGCAPYVPSRGSVGASGDLAPLAHLAQLLLGEGKAFVDGKLKTAKKALQVSNLEKLELEAKEGLALINGTQAMTAVGCIAVSESQKLWRLANMIGACSFEALLGSHTAFDPRIHLARPHPGQVQSAQLIRSLLKGSKMLLRAKPPRVQDPYSLRCIPQVHGAVMDALSHVKNIIEIEINSSTDNPLVFWKRKGIKSEIDILSGGNFHGQYLAFSLDYLAIVVSALANISERRLEHLVNPALSAGLPPFLTPSAGLSSGFMVLQVSAASLINENKILCHPASTDSIPTSANREDFVSMGMTSANKSMQVIENVYKVLAIELFASCQALDLRKPKTPGQKVQKIFETVRKKVHFAPTDRPYLNDFHKILNLIKSNEFFEVIGL